MFGEVPIQKYAFIPGLYSSSKNLKCANLNSNINKICFMETKPSINNIKAKEKNVSPTLVTALGYRVRGALRLRPEWCTELFSGQLGIHGQILSTKTYKQEDSNSRLLNCLITEYH